MQKKPLALALSLASLGTLALLSTPVIAANKSQNKQQLDTVTISGTRTETSVMNNPSSIAVLTREQIENRVADSVAEKTT